MRRLTTATTRLRGTACPYCGHEISAATNTDLVFHDDEDGPDDRMPEAGDGALCLYCAEFAVYSERIELRRPTAAETEEIMADPQLVWLQQQTKAWLQQAREQDDAEGH